MTTARDALGERRLFSESVHTNHSLSRVVVLSTSFYKIFVKFRNSEKNVLKIVLIIVNINKDENKSLISNQFSLKKDPSPTSWRTFLRR